LLIVESEDLIRSYFLPSAAYENTSFVFRNKTKDLLNLPTLELSLPILVVERTPLSKMARHNGKNRDELPPEQILCTRHACAIQYCLARHNHQEKYCKAIVQEWEKCRDMARALAANEGTPKQVEKS
jgi:hypothetical protein